MHTTEQKLEAARKMLKALEAIIDSRPMTLPIAVHVAATAAIAAARAAGLKA